jgi:D-alanyl-D-alanine carboxypeptidase
MKNPNSWLYSFFLIVVACTPLSSQKSPDLVLVHDHFTFTRGQWNSFVALQSEALAQKIRNDEEFFLNLIVDVLHQDSDLLIRVDKAHHLSATFIPTDLVALDTLKWPIVSRVGHELRYEAVQALQLMHEASQAEGVRLVIGSTYRSYQRQQSVYQSWVNQLGQEQADRLSAKAGSSQHQLGTTLDFSPINSNFTGTKAQHWLVDNAYKYGFSLSFPLGHEKQIGYDYESWHYRYIGVSAAQLEQQFFAGLQYELIAFWQQHQQFFKDHVTMLKCKTINS